MNSSSESTSISDLKNSKQAQNMTGLLLTVILIALVILGVVAYFKQRQINPSQNNDFVRVEQESIPTDQIFSPDETDIEKVTFTNDNLPGFAMEYPEDWEVELKEFDEIQPKNFVSKYFDNSSCPNDTCMGVRFKKNNVNFELVFDKITEDSAVRCSDSVVAERVNDNWFRFKQSYGYFYSSEVSTDYTLEFAIESDTNRNDEWEYEEGETYNYCLFGNGSLLSQNLPDDPDSGIAYGVLLEEPLIKGNPTTSLLDELDEMIESMIGLDLSEER